MEGKTKHSLVTANDIVRRHGLSYQTLNYYTNLGLLSVVKRNGNERLYDDRRVEQQLEAVAQLKSEGYPLRLITRMLAGELESAVPNGGRNSRVAK